MGLNLAADPPLPIVASRRRRALWISGAIALVTFAVLALLDRELQDTGGPGIVPFEVAFTSDRAQEILGEWGDEGRDTALVSLLVDYVYLVAWALFFSLACSAVAARQRSARLARIGTTAAWAALVAGLCDALEDAALLGVLATDGDQPLPLAAGIFASVKFVLLGLVLLYLAVGLIASRRAGPPAEADLPAAQAGR